MDKVRNKKYYKKFGDFYAANNITFTAEEGEFVTLLGPSGCGKTSLLKLIAGFHVADEGEILIGGKNVNNVPPENAIQPCVSNPMPFSLTSTFLTIFAMV